MTDAAFDPYSVKVQIKEWKDIERLDHDKVAWYLIAHGWTSFTDEERPQVLVWTRSSKRPKVLPMATIPIEILRKARPDATVEYLVLVGQRWADHVERMGDLLFALAYYEGRSQLAVLRDLLGEGG